jgi:predicted XRE-type DNA-binding protein
MTDDVTITRSAGNVFADLGLANADDRLLKARVAMAINRIITDEGLTQTAAAERMGIAQPDVSRILKGRLNGFSLERLLDFFTALGGDVEIKLKLRPAGRSEERPREGEKRVLVVEAR